MLQHDKQLTHGEGMTLGESDVGIYPNKTMHCQFYLHMKKMHYRANRLQIDHSSHPMNASPEGQQHLRIIRKNNF